MMLRGIGAAVAVFLLSMSAAFATDCSGTITAGGTAQKITQVNSNTKGVLIINNGANLMCFSINGVDAAIAGTNCAAGSYPLQPGSSTLAGGSFSNPDNIRISTLSIVSNTAGDRFSCERQ